MNLGRSSVEFFGAAKSRLYTFLKPRPRLKRVALAAYATLSRNLIRLRPSKHNDRPLELGMVERWIGSWNSANPARAASYVQVHPAQRIHNEFPQNIIGYHDPEHERVIDAETPAAFVATMPDGHVVGEHGSVITPDGIVLVEVSQHIGIEGYNSEQSRNPPDPWALYVESHRSPRRLRGSAAVLSAYFGRGYFHWLYDVLPRFGLLRNAGIDVASVDHFVVPSYFAPFQIETLRVLGIPSRRLVSSFQHRHVVADQLLVPSLPRPLGLIPSWLCEFLRDSFPPKTPEVALSPERLYIVRRMTDHGLLANDDSLMALLVQQGFTPVALEQFSLSEKAWLMSRAEVIVSPSGGGLCNIVFCRPGTTVVELRVQPFPVIEAWAIANMGGLRFYDVLPDGYRRDEKTVARGYISPDAVVQTLDMAGCLR